MTVSRRSFLAGSAALAVTTTAAPYVHAQKKGGTLRFVPHADLKILDPIWTTAYITTRCSRWTRTSSCSRRWWTSTRSARTP